MTDQTDEKGRCAGSTRIPTDLTRINGAKWGRCPSCKQMRPLAMGGWIKVHQVAPGLSSSPGSPSSAS